MFLPSALRPGMRAASCLVTSLAVVLTGLVVATAPAAATAVICPTAATAFAEGSGTADDPYLISTPAELQLLHDAPSYWSSVFALTADIDMGGCVWTSGIGSYGAPFSGELDGAHQVISGLSVQVTRSSRYFDAYAIAGLFGHLGSGGRLHDLGFIGNVAVAVTITATYGLYGASAVAGGLVADTDTNSTISNCFMKGTVTATATSPMMSEVEAGGLVGWHNGSMTESFVVGSVSANATEGTRGGYVRVGGAIGFLSNAGRVTHTYAAATVVTPAPTSLLLAGGFIGDRDTHPGYEGVAVGNLWDTTVGLPVGVAPPGTTSGVTGGSTTELTTLSTFSGQGWDIASGTPTDTTWGICSSVNSGYPFLLGLGTCVTDVAVTADSPTSIDTLTALPAVAWTTSPPTSASDWSTKPSCAAYASNDVAFSSPLSGTQAAGTYVTHCTGGVSSRFRPASYVDGSLVVTRYVPQAPTITAPPSASDIVFGQSLGNSVLTGGEASVPGSFAWTSPVTVPGAGSTDWSVTFTPTDAVRYATATTSAAVRVAKAVPQVSAPPTAAGLTYGQSLAASTLTGGAAEVPGSFSWTDAATLPGAGSADWSVTFTPDDTEDYETTTTTVSVAVAKAVPLILMAPTAGDLTYGQGLPASSLSGGLANTAGIFTWTNAGTMPSAGTQAYSVTFTPQDTANFETMTTSVAVKVAKGVPSIVTAPTASSVSFGQPLAASILTGGAASVPGTFAWTDPSDALPIGTTQHSVRFTPTDASNYDAVTVYVSVAVGFATPTIITPPTASSVIAGQPLSASLLTGGAANVEGYFSWTNPATTTAAGVAPYSVTFTPANPGYTTTVLDVWVNAVTPQATTVLYTGQQIVTAPAAFTVSAETSGPLTCTAPTYALDRNPVTGGAGAYPLAPVSGSVATAGWRTGVYLVTVSYGGSGACLLSTDTATLTVAAAGDSADGAGHYSTATAGRVDFGFSVARSGNGYSGSLSIVNGKRWRMRNATISAYVRSGSSGAVSGTAALEWWNPNLNGGKGGWVVVSGSVQYAANFSATTAKSKGTFGIKISYLPTVGLPPLPNSAPQTITKGSIVIA